MSAESIYSWAVLIPSARAGKRWHVFDSRAKARAFRAEQGGEIYKVVRSH